MQHNGLAWFFVLLALMTVTVSVRVLSDRHWFQGWFRGSSGLLLLWLAVWAALLGRDFYTYVSVPDEKPVATLFFKQLGQQQYQVTLLEGSTERVVSLEGDLLQLDVRFLGWKGLGAAMGLKSTYRLEHMSGRYLSIEQMEMMPRNDVQLARSYGVDIWQWLMETGRDLLVFKPKNMSVNYLPMTDGAVYSLSVRSTGLMVTPLNDTAQKALK